MHHPPRQCLNHTGTTTINGSSVSYVVVSIGNLSSIPSLAPDCPQGAPALASTVALTAAAINLTVYYNASSNVTMVRQTCAGRWARRNGRMRAPCACTRHAWSCMAGRRGNRNACLHASHAWPTPLPHAPAPRSPTVMASWTFRRAPSSSQSTLQAGPSAPTTTSSWWSCPCSPATPQTTLSCLMTTLRLPPMVSSCSGAAPCLLTALRIRTPSCCTCTSGMHMLVPHPSATDTCADTTATSGATSPSSSPVVRRLLRQTPPGSASSGHANGNQGENASQGGNDDSGDVQSVSAVPQIVPPLVATVLPHGAVHCGACMP